MEAELGNNPLFVWQSLLSAREVIGAATKWKVGDGRSIDVVDLRWLSHLPVFLNNPPPSMKVCEIINQANSARGL